MMRVGRCRIEAKLLTIPPIAIVGQGTSICLSDDGIVVEFKVSQVFVWLAIIIVVIDAIKVLLERLSAIWGIRRMAWLG
jgi:hypothetical protein